MSFYSKISLLALLAAGTALGMEQPPHLKAPAKNTDSKAINQPELKHPAKSAAAQALNERMIDIKHNNILIAKIQENYLRISPTFKGMLEDTGNEGSLEIPDSLVTEVREAQDLFAYEFRLQNELTDTETIKRYLVNKTEQQLADIVNACQRFELNTVSPIAIEILAKKLLHSKYTCLSHGTYGLALTNDTALLVAQAMVKQSNFTARLATYLAFLAIGGLEYSHLRERSGNAHNNFNKWWDSYEKTPVMNCFFNDIPDAIQFKLLAMARVSKSDEAYTIVSYTQLDENCDIIFWSIPPFILSLTDKLKPEQVILLQYLVDQAHLNGDLFHQWPGIEIIFKTLPKNVQRLLNKSSAELWISGHPYIRNMALAAIGTAAAWYGYKYFSKKM